ncbi:ExeA family protein [Oceanidesulfovibrio marinus]|uniref:AAA+ ATPase domain-containing protein n=1 Tax=Oceanidesulfovibrio marinus TaxID=370038 RepID=A0A6P1ZJ28_9BACT|nr:AAA family ATPase [Oceanidesulfovibrio marinus]TVM33150.1 hypothetical protein DQK91_13415 [Oceanidesulfovibrio marinus]
MKYFEILNFQDEPFSNSPDPDFFYESPGHLDCLNRLEIALRLKRGLNVVLGDVGTGKTTLCRRLLRVLADDDTVKAYLLLDPDFDNPRDLLLVLCEMLEGTAPEAGLTEWSLKERVKNCLFQRGIDDNKTIVLIIDEGQKIHDRCMELLRELLNYETNNSKLLQIVIFAQLEFEPVIKRFPNFADRINDLIRLGPLNFRHTKELIDYRINLARVHMSRTPLFTWGGYYAMYRATGGYPRKIVKLAHKIFLTLILNNDHRANWSLVRTVSKENYLAESTKFPSTRTEIGASKSLFASPRSSQPDALADDIEGSRYAWLAGAVVVLLCLLIAVRAETPTESSLSLGNAPELTQPTRHVADMSEPDLHADVEEVAEVKAEPVDVAETQDLTETQDVIEAQEASLPTKTAQVADALSYRAKMIARTLPDDDEPAGKAAARVRQIPEELGTITLAEATDLKTIINRVYGHFSDEIVSQVLAGNASLPVTGEVPAGTTLTFPVVRKVNTADEPKTNGFVVQVGRYTSLEKAYTACSSLRSNSAEEPGVAIVPQWSVENGLVFSLVYAKAYEDEGEALHAIREHKQPVEQTPEIVAAWGDAELLTDVAAWQPAAAPVEPSTSGDLFPPRSIFE